MNDLWLLQFAWPVAVSDAAPPLPLSLALAPDAAGLQVCRSLDGSAGLAYLPASNASPGAEWVRLRCLRDLPGASSNARAACHYVVETDVLPEHEDDFNAWYEEEHLPGLASVPGTVRAARYAREAGVPRYYACYDLATLDTFESPAWLAVRGSDWSSRVRPSFRNTRRTMYRRVSG